MISRQSLDLEQLYAYHAIREAATETNKGKAGTTCIFALNINVYCKGKQIFIIQFTLKMDYTFPLATFDFNVLLKYVC